LRRGFLSLSSFFFFFKGGWGREGVFFNRRVGCVGWVWGETQREEEHLLSTLPLTRRLSLPLGEREYRRHLRRWGRRKNDSNYVRMYVTCGFFSFLFFFFLAG
jgi:hypothetical protein